MEPSLTSLNNSSIKPEILNQGGENDNDSDNDADKEIQDDDEDDEEDYMKMYSETPPQENNPAITTMEDDDTNERETEDDIEVERDKDELETQESSDTEIDERRITRSMSNRDRIKRIRRALHRLDTSYNPTAPKRLRGRNNYIQTDDLGHKIYNTAIISDPGEPSTIKEAMSGKDKKLWIPSIKNEVMNFIK